MALFFDVSGEDLGRLDPVRAVQLFRNLVVSEAVTIGIDIGKVVIPSTSKAINTSDGGIDGEVSDARPIRQGHGIIKEGLTCYQIKTGSSAEVKTLSGARNVISVNGNICPRVKTCIEREGTLVIVLFGSDAPEQNQNQSKGCIQQAIREFLPEYPEYQNIEVWRQSQIIGFLDHFPSLRLSINGRGPSDLYNINTWKSTREMSYELQIGDSQHQAIQAIRESVDPAKTTPTRILGDPGVGKTRLTLEALGDEKYASQIIYARDFSSIPQGFITALMQPDNHERCILVIDECDRRQHDRLSDQLFCVSDRVKLVTISCIGESAYDAETQIVIYPLNPEDISRILETSYRIPAFRATELAGFCGGSPRVAHMVGAQIERTGDIDITRTDNVWERCIAGTDDPLSETAKKRMRILKWLSLFRRFGYERPFSAEGNQIVALISKHTSIPESEIREEIRVLRDRKLLQGDCTLYITPKLMHIWLWTAWWKDQESGFSFENFKHVDENSELEPKLIEWFFEMIEYAKESDMASFIVQELLGEQGPFVEPAFLESGTGTRLLSALANVAPRETLEFIESWLAPLDKEDLMELRTSRRGFIDALQHIAWEPLLFRRAAEALLKLALAENESYSNNATGVFAGLFSNGIGVLAPSKASPEQRFPTLKQVALSESKSVQAIAVKAISKALEVETSVLRAVRDSEMLHKTQEGWMPDTYGEWWGVYRNVWKLSLECLGCYDTENKALLLREMQSKAIHLISFIGDGSEVVAWLTDLVRAGYAERDNLTKGVIHALRYSHKLSGKARDALEELKSELIGTGFENELYRYVGIEITEDEYDTEREAGGILEEKLNDLAEHAIRNPDELQTVLPWLIDGNFRRAFAFGNAIGKHDVDFGLWGAILRTTINRCITTGKASPQLCSGYLYAVYNRDADEWIELIEEASVEPCLSGIIPALICGSGMSDRAFEIIVCMFDGGLIDVDALYPLRFGTVLSNVDHRSVIDFLEKLVAKNTATAAELALDLAYSYSRDGRALPRETCRNIVMQDSLFTGDTPWSSFTDYCWRSMALTLIADNREYVGELVSFVVTTLRSNAQLEESYYSEVLCETSRIDPNSTWEAVAPAVEAGDYSVISCFMGWFEHNQNKPIERIPVDIILSWVELDAELRAPIVARHILSDLYDKHEKPLLAREILVRFGTNEKVSDALTANELSFSWSGSEEDALKSKLEKMHSYKAIENESNVVCWIEYMIDLLERKIVEAHIREERGW